MALGTFFVGDFSSTSELTVYIEQLVNGNNYVANKQAAAVLGTTGKNRMVTSEDIEELQSSPTWKSRYINDIRSRSVFKAVMENISRINNQQVKSSLCCYMMADSSAMTYYFRDIFFLNETSDSIPESILKQNAEINKWIKDHYRTLFARILMEQQKYYDMVKKDFGDEVYKIMTDFDYIFKQDTGTIYKKCAPFVTSKKKEDELRTIIPALRLLLGSIYSAHETKLCDEFGLDYKKYCSLKREGIAILASTMGYDILRDLKESSYF